MMDVAKAAVQEALRNGAHFADARVVRVRRQDLALRNGAVDGADSSEELGVGVRVLVDGNWGFFAAPLFSDPKVAEQTARACGRRVPRVAQGVAACAVEPVKLSAEAGHVGEYRTSVREEPLAVPLAEKLALLREADASMAGNATVVVRESSLSVRVEEQWFASSEGAELYQELVRTGAGIAATAAAHGAVERRSYPASFGGDYASRGFEHAREMELAAHGARMRDEAAALCSAPLCPAGRRDLVLMGNQLMLQIHESVGHPTEIDRVFGHEADLAGTSFLGPEHVGRLRYGSPLVNLVADATVPGGLDTRGWDDDGVPSQAWPIVRDGIFQGFLTSREWAGRAGETRSRGSNRAEGWHNQPIVRITNLSLMPGSSSLDELIAGVEDGVLCEGVKTWSIDQKRVNFQFTTEIGWEIRGGRRGALLRSPTYQGRTVDFWNSCDGIAGPAEWRLWGVPNCGKGNPMQVAEMSHGCAPARFRRVAFVR